MVVGAFCVPALRRRRSVWVPLSLAAAAVSLAASIGIGLNQVARHHVTFATVAGCMGCVVALVFAVVVLAANAGPRPRWQRMAILGGGAVVLWLVVYPMSVAYEFTDPAPTHLGATTPATYGLSYRTVRIPSSPGVTLAGWYVASHDGAAVIVVAGAGETRADVLPQGVVLARRGFGVLFLDNRGHGTSGGTAMDLGWYGRQDLGAAVTWLVHRPGLAGDRIAVLGESVGGEEAVEAAAADSRIRAVVDEGGFFQEPSDLAWLPDDPAGWVQRGIYDVMFASLSVLSPAPAPPSMVQALRTLAPRRALLVAGALAHDEPVAGRFLERASPSDVSLWVAPGATHTGGLDADPIAWPARVVSFLAARLGVRAAR